MIASKDVLRFIGTFVFSLAMLALPGAAFADAGHAHGSASIGKPGAASAVTRTVQVKLGDMFYEPKAIQARPGETIRFVLTNAGELLHEFNIGTAAMHTEHQKEMLAMMDSGMLTPTGINTDMSKMDHSKMDGHSMKHDDPNSVLVEPGKKGELIWTFTEAADLQFACNIPGHYESGMVGNIKFQR